MAGRTSIWAAAFGLMALLGPAAQAQPARILSLNTCADQYLIRLADPDQIAALTRFATDPDLSFYAKEAKRYPRTGGSGEEILVLQPDLILVSPFQAPDIRTLIAEHGFATVAVPTAYSFDDIVANTRTIAEAIGHPERGEALIADMRRQLAALQHSAGPERTALHYQRRGYLTGERSLMSEIMAAAGLDNIAGRAAAGMIGRISLETLLTVQPDLIVTSLPPGRIEDLGTELLEHPALTRFYGPTRRIYLPRTFTICGGPSYPDAVGHLQDQIPD